MMFHQIHGTAMGAAFSPSLASTFMSDITQLSIYTNHYTFITSTLHWRCLYPLMTDCLDFMTALNNFHPSLPFTFTHSLFSVNFLDLAIYKGPQFQTNQHVGITTHQKQHNLYQYLRFTSTHPRTIYKGLIIRELIRYIWTNTSSDKYIQLNPHFSKPSYLQQCPL